jgi:hypothetical protein
VFDGLLRHRPYGMTKGTVVGLVGLVLASSPTRALDVKTHVTNGWSFGWAVTLSADRTVDASVLSEGRSVTRRSEVSRKALLELQAVLQRERFFSLPPRLGSFPPDAPYGEIEVRDGGKRHKVVLGVMDQDLAVIWKTDPSSEGRAYRVCEALRIAFVGSASQSCPGVPSVSSK